MICKPPPALTMTTSRALPSPHLPALFLSQNDVDARVSGVLFHVRWEQGANVQRPTRADTRSTNPRPSTSSLHLTPPPHPSTSSLHLIPPPHPSTSLLHLTPHPSDNSANHSACCVQATMNYDWKACACSHTWGVCLCMLVPFYTHA